MKQSTLPSLVLALLLCSAGCSGGKSPGSKEERQPDIGPDVRAVNSPSELFHASTELANALADVLTDIKDEDSASKAEPRIDVLNKKAQLLAVKSKELHIDSQLQQRLEEQFKDETDKAKRRIEAEKHRIKADPKLSKVLQVMNLKGLLE